MINNIKCIMMLLGIILPTAFCHANSRISTEKDGGDAIVNGKTTLSYTLSDDSDAEVFVFNMLGNKILHIESVRQNSGSHEVELDLSNMPDGMYFCNIYTGNNNNKTFKIIKH